MDLNDANLVFTELREVINRLFNGFGCGSKYDDDALCVGRAGVLAYFILPARQRRETVHARLHDFRDCNVIRVDRLASLKIGVWVLRRAANKCVFWTEGARAVIVYALLVDHCRDVLILYKIDRIDFM